MSRSAWNSVRVRLTLGNAVVLALLLGVSAIALCYRVQEDLAASVDSDLGRDARDFATRVSHLDPHIQSLSGNRTNGGGGPGKSWVLPSPRAWTAREMDFRRPRHLTPRGKPLDPFGEDRPWDLEALSRAASGRESYSTIRIGDRPVRVFTLPVVDRTRKVNEVIQVAYPIGALERLARGQVRTLLTLLPIAMLVAALAGISLTGRTLRPVREITQVAGQIGAEDLSRRLDVTSQDEFGELAATFNGMIARLQEGFQRVESAYEQQRRFTGDASHELRTPLSFIKGSASLALRESRSAEGYRQALRVVDQAADQMNLLIQDLLLLARADAGRFQLARTPLEVGSLLADALSCVAVETGPPVHVELPEEPITVWGHHDTLVRLFVNLIGNAFRHTPQHGRITLRARGQVDRVVIQVEDTGEGIPPEHLPHLFERFYRVDAARARTEGGTGLGLAICQSIVQAHGGTIEIESTVGKGTSVSVVLPGCIAPTPLPRETAASLRLPSLSEKMPARGA